MSEENPTNVPQGDVLRMATEIVSAFVSNNSITANQVPDVINTVYVSLQALNGQSAEAPTEPPKPAVSVRRSVMPDYIVCLEDGKKLKMLKRHLKTRYDMSPEEYRKRWGLPEDYPMVAPSYAQQRSALAKKIGLGTKPRARQRRGAA